ncbi:MAG: hypothetical protein IH859_06440 [Chloroflexi bacterium]|nr:hypothetical protein [Chloroflexota bacterium]
MAKAKLGMVTGVGVFEGIGVGMGVLVGIGVRVGVRVGVRLGLIVELGLGTVVALGKALDSGEAVGALSALQAGKRTISTAMATGSVFIRFPGGMRFHAEYSLIWIADVYTVYLGPGVLAANQASVNTL